MIRNSHTISHHLLNTGGNIAAMVVNFFRIVKILLRSFLGTVDQDRFYHRTSGFGILGTGN